jgi:DNA-binding NarL/FixJ family response regulator
MPIQNKALGQERGMRKRSILVVDDHPAMRQGLGKLLGSEEHWYIAGEAGTREDALRIAAAERPDLIILDIELGYGLPSGLDLIKEMRKLLGAIPILVFSLHEEPVIIDLAFKAGAMGYVTKQQPVQELIKACIAVLAGEKYGAPANSSTNGGPDRLTEKLSAREFEILHFIGLGYSTSHMAETLNISVKTVESHKYGIKKKLGFASIAEMRLFAVGSAVQNRFSDMDKPMVNTN